jgi:hypothetical protein
MQKHPHFDTLKANAKQQPTLTVIHKVTPLKTVDGRYVPPPGFWDILNTEQPIGDNVASVIHTTDVSPPETRQVARINDPIIDALNAGVDVPRTRYTSPRRIKKQSTTPKPTMWQRVITWFKKVRSYYA